MPSQVMEAAETKGQTQVLEAEGSEEEEEGSEEEAAIEVARYLDQMPLSQQDLHVFSIPSMLTIGNKCDGPFANGRI